MSLIRCHIISYLYTNRDHNRISANKLSNTNVSDTTLAYFPFGEQRVWIVVEPTSSLTRLRARFH